MHKRIFLIFLFVISFGYTSNVMAAYWWKKVGKEMENIGENLAKLHKMEFLNQHVGAIVDSRKVAWDISLLSHQSLTVEQARPMVVAMIEYFWKKVNENPIFFDGLQQQRKAVPTYDPELAPRRLGIRIAFWDEDVNRPLPPYLARIKVLEGRIEYYQADPQDQSLQQPYIETVEEAFQKVYKTL